MFLSSYVISCAAQVLTILTISTSAQCQEQQLQLLTNME